MGLENLIFSIIQVLYYLVNCIKFLLSCITQLIKHAILECKVAICKHIKILAYNHANECIHLKLNIIFQILIKLSLIFTFNIYIYIYMYMYEYKSG